MPKSKNTELNFLYMDEENIEQKENKSKKKKTKKNNTDNMPKGKKEKINLDNEIIIGVTVPNKNTSNKKKAKNKNKRADYNTSAQEKKQNNKKERKKADKQIKKKKQNNKIEKPKKKSIAKTFIKWCILIVALIAALIFFLMSPLFNISEIEVVNNKKISSDTIISLSKIEIGENIYKITSSNVKKNIKENAYIDKVTVKRVLPSKIQITVEEREATYMLEYANSYAYINNQGYILDIKEEKLQIPIIKGYTTIQEDIKPGLRLNENDLERLQTVLRIMEATNSNGIGKLVSIIDVSDKQNYTLIMEESKKIAYLGDATNLSNRMLYLKAILQDEEGIEGEIFLNMDLNKENVFFRKKE